MKTGIITNVKRRCCTRARTAAPVCGDKVPCLYPGCERVFDNHIALSEHMFAEHGAKPALCSTDVIAEAEAILAANLPVAEWPWEEGGQTDEDQGSTADDPDPEPEEGSSDDSASNSNSDGEDD